jgi:hypothetical protein
LAVDASAVLATVPEIRLRLPVTLPAVTTRGQRPRVQRSDQVTTDLGPGATSLLPSRLDLTSGLSGNLTGDIGSALATLTNVSADPTSQGGLGGISAFGLAGAENSATVNGLSFNAGSIPPDGFSLQAVTTTYDPGKGGFAGLNASLRFSSGKPESVRSLRAALDAPQLQWRTTSGTELSDQRLRGIVGGEVGGGIGAGEHALYHGSAQLVRSDSRRANLAVAGPRALSLLGLSQDTVQRLLQTMSTLGIPPAVSDRWSGRSTSLSAFGRFDYRPEAALQGSRGSLESGFSSADDQFTILVGVNADATRTASDPASLSLARTRISRSNVLIAGTLSRYLFGWLLNELSLSLQTGVTNAGPDVDLPAGSVLVTPTAPGGALSTLAFGGTGAGRGTSRLSTFEVRNETAWNTSDRTHQWKVTLDGTLGISRSAATPVFGRVAYNSIDDLAAGQPAMFSRWLSGQSVSSRALNAAIGIGGTYTPFAKQITRPQLRIQYGVRGEANAVLSVPARNEVLASALGVDTHSAPTLFAIEPMLGFSVPLGQMPPEAAAGALNRATVFGGVREYRAALSPTSLDAYQLQAGLASSVARVLWIGSDVPKADWSRFAESVLSVPDRCDEGPVAAFTDDAPNVSVFSPDFDLSRSWRAELGTGGYLAANTWGAVQVTRVQNIGLPETVDRNFDSTIRFAVQGEDSRPVFVSPSAIDPTTGLMLHGASRRSSQFGSVLETRSDAGQRLWQTSALLARTFGTLSNLHVYSTHTLSYTYKTGHEDIRGFSASTSGDPFVVEGARLGQPRHTASYSASLSVPRWGRIAGLFGAASAARFTPRVIGDLNGDGLSNDRPFVFEPARVDDPALRDGIQNLLISAPAAIRRCLQQQLGHVAARNSCSAPSRTWLNVSITPDPYRLRLGNRGTFSVIATNVLGGLDAMLHGPSRTRGWGAAAIPDPTLLAVRGFDPARQRFRYSVNPAFGSTSAARSTLSAPFTLTMNFRVDLGPDQESRALAAFLSSPFAGQSAAPTEPEIRARLDRGFGAARFADLLSRRDSLGLSDQQAQSIARIIEEFSQGRSRAYDALARRLAKKSGDFSSGEARDAWHETLSFVALSQNTAWSRIRSLLSSEQYAKLPSSWKIHDDLSPSSLRHALKAPLPVPP